MIKKVSVRVFLLSTLFSLIACTPHDEHYYKGHPEALQEVIAKCPTNPPKLVSCDVLHKMALQVNDLVYELRLSPQGYGKKILALQEKIAKQESSHQSDKRSLLNKNKQELRERLAIVNWLESPAS